MLYQEGRSSLALTNIICGSTCIKLPAKPLSARGWLLPPHYLQWLHWIYVRVFVCVNPPL